MSNKRNRGGDAMAKSDYGRDMYRQLTEVMARLERVEEKSQESERSTKQRYGI